MFELPATFDIIAYSHLTEAVSSHGFQDHTYFSFSPNLSGDSASLYFVGHFSNVQQINKVITQSPLLWPTLFFLFTHSLYSSSSLTSSNIYLLTSPQLLSPS